MLEVNSTQGKILQKFVENFTDKSGKYPHGLSSHILENLGIVAKTFRLNKNYLEDDYLIRLNRIEYHGHQHWFFYQITKLGIIAYLMWLTTNKNINKTILTKLSFPLIIKNWTLLHKKYGKLLDEIIMYTTNHIEITPSLTVISKDGTGHSRLLNESITLAMGKVDFKIFRQYEPPEIIPTKKLKGDVMRVDDFSDKANSEIDTSITNRFTFLFFFNLINLGIEDWEMKILYSHYKKEVDISKLKKDLERTSKKLAKNSESVMSLIKKDKALNSLFRSMLDEITAKLKDIKAINQLKKELF